jgi:hypothetical protein
MFRGVVVGMDDTQHSREKEDTGATCGILNMLWDGKVEDSMCESISRAGVKDEGFTRSAVSCYLPSIISES